MKSTFAICATALTGLGLLLMPVAAQAQAPAAPSTTKPDAAPSSSAISDNKLDAAAAALKNVSAIRQTYEQKVDRAATEDKSRLQNEATAAMKKAVNDQGLSVEEYADIIQVAQADPVVRNKLLQRLK